MLSGMLSVSVTEKNGATNPFRFGAVVQGAAFADRERERAELLADLLNGQDAVLMSPRRYGKTSLALAAADRARAEGVTVAYCDLTLAASRERLAAVLAGAVVGDLLPAGARGRRRALELLRRLTLRPSVTVDDSGRMAFGFSAGAERADVDRTIDELLALPGELAGRGRRLALVLDELPALAGLDPGLLARMRAAFQHQADVAHVYLGSERALMERVFTREGEPFYRAARVVRLDVIPAALFRGFIIERMAASGRPAEPAVVDDLLAFTGGHPHLTQALCYFLWAEAGDGDAGAGPAALARARERLLDSEDAHCASVVAALAAGQRLLLGAVAAEAGRPLTREYRARHGLSAESAVQKALRTLADRDLLTRDAGGAWAVADPVLAAWLARRAGA